MANNIYKKDGQDRLLPKLCLFIFDRSRTAAILWLCLAVFGVLSYTTFMKRQGFPSVNVPFSVINGAYIVNSPARVDQDVVKPISDIALKDSKVKSVQTQAQGNSYSVSVAYKDGTNATTAGKDLAALITTTAQLPKQATVNFITPKFGLTQRGDDAVITVYAKNASTNPQSLVTEGNNLVNYVKSQNVPDVQDLSVIDPFIQGTNPVTGKLVTSQLKFDRYGVRENGNNDFFNSVVVGVTQKAGTDVIQLDDQLRAVVTKYNNQQTNPNYASTVSASYAPDIKSQIGELQKALLEGLAAVLIVGSIVIAIRASIITVLSMLTVLATTIGILYLIGYSLNTITLFALILCLGLIVDDTIIMVEALDAQRRKSADARDTVHEATRKVSRAMVAATTTAALSFAPLLFAGGILGSFIRAIPITVITSLLVSLVVALVFIPLFARYILLGKKQMGNANVHEIGAGVEEKIAQFIGKPMLWAQHSKKKLTFVGLTAVIVGLGFVAAGGLLFSKVTFNIFPPSKDTNGLIVGLTFNPDTTVTQAETIADQVDSTVAKSLGTNFVQASYYGSGTNNSANLLIDIISYNKRSITAPELVKQLDGKLQGVKNVQVKVGQKDVGPPASAFTVRIESPERTKAIALAKDINTFLTNKELTRLSGTKAKITTTSISSPSTFTRNDGNLYVEVTANFDATDTTTLVTLAQSAVQKEFTSSKIASYGLPASALKFDFGQESDNQNSFKTLAYAFPVLLFVIYLLLALQFSSFLQPLLIFVAIPFSLFGIMLGLYLTDNAFSFFAMLGFFALIGLSLKNTILLTDYANQLRRKGFTPVDAAVGALSERFRPLIATSLTAVVSLIPLAITSPFWEGLTVVLIGGLLSSTFLVIFVFPYYYLGAEFLRITSGRAFRRIFKHKA